MYQGKFDAKRKKGSVDPMELLAQRNAAPKKEAPKKAAPAKPTPDQEELLTRKKAAATAEALSRKSAPRQTSAAENEVTARKTTGKQAAPIPEAPRKKGPRTGGVIFYTFYFMFILLFFVAVYLGLQWLQSWLVDYEAAQPTAKSQQVFEQLFTDPDWGALYDAAAEEDTSYEGKDTFVAYMESKVGTTPMTYMETSAGLSRDKKYIVKLGEEKIASFTLVDKTQTGEGLNEIAAIPEWDLGSIELFYAREQSYLIQNLEGHTVYVNGVALDESFIIQKATTVATKYLPRPVAGVTLCTEQISGLLTVPTVTIQDENGSEMEVTYDAATRTFTERTEANTISSEEEQVVINAAKTYGLYMIEKASRAQVAKYFDTSSDAYTAIIGSKFGNFQDNSGYEFANETVSEYCRYADDLFSARVTLSLNVTRTDGSIKEFAIDSTLFFEKQSTGNWLAFEMTSVNVQEPVGEVRLTFMDGEEEVSSKFYDTNSTELTVPMVSAPEGKVFTGWVRENVEEDGTTTLTVVFTPDASGYVSIPSGTTLEPMTLHALFEDAPTTESEGA